MVISSGQGITVAAGRDSAQPKKNTRAKIRKVQQITSRVIAVALVIETPKEVATLAGECSKELLIIYPQKIILSTLKADRICPTGQQASIYPYRIDGYLWSSRQVSKLNGGVICHEICRLF